MLNGECFIVSVDQVFHNNEQVKPKTGLFKAKIRHCCGDKTDLAGLSGISPVLIDFLRISPTTFHQNPWKAWGSVERKLSISSSFSFDGSTGDPQRSHRFSMG
jgi:hypothetical protein